MNEENRAGFFPDEPTFIGPSDPTLRTGGNPNTKASTPPSHETAQAPAANDATLQRGMTDETPVDSLTLQPDPVAIASEERVQTFGDYQLLELIARGGMGVVYKARQKKLNRIVAIKMILSGQFADQHQIDRFYAEAEAAANLRHPNIVAVHEIGTVGGQHFFSMDFIDGKSLADVVRDHPLSARQAAEYVRCISETMQFAHERGILHRDLKPSNVLVDKRDEPLITDFGLAKQVSSQSQLTMTGAVVGTPSYMPPEQASGRHDDAGPPSDIYSLGAILYELITGRPPFRAATPYETIRQVLENEPVSPRLINPSVPHDLETICLKCLQKEPTRRYATAGELADELARFLEGKPILARPLGRVARTWRWCRRNPRLAAAIATAVTCVCIAFAAVSIGLVVTRRALDEAQDNFVGQMAAVNDLFTRVSEDTLLRQDGMQPLRRDLLKLALSYYEKLLDRRGNDPRLKNEIAAAHFRIGVITGVLQSAEQARPHFEVARDMQTRLLLESPNDAQRLLALGNTLNGLGNALTELRDLGEATRVYDQAIRIRMRLAQQTHRDPDHLRLLANTYMNKGHALAENGKPDAAWQAYETAQRIRTEALARKPRDPELLRDFAKGDYSRGTHRALVSNDFEAARNYVENAARILDELLAERPQDPENQQLSAICYLLLGDLAAKKQDADEARRWYDLALERMLALTTSNPNVLDFQLEYAGLLMNRGELEREYAAVDKARDAFDAACDILLPLVEKYPEEPRFRYNLAVALHALGEQRLHFGETADARENLIQARRYFQELQAEMPAEENIPAKLESIEQLLVSSNPS